MTNKSETSYLGTAHRENTDNRSWGTHPETCQIQSWENSHKQIRDSHRQNTVERGTFWNTYHKQLRKIPYVGKYNHKPLWDFKSWDIRQQIRHLKTYKSHMETSALIQGNPPKNTSEGSRTEMYSDQNFSDLDTWTCTYTQVRVLHPAIYMNKWLRDLILGHTKQIRDFKSRNIRPQSSLTLLTLKKSTKRSEDPAF